MLDRIPPIAFAFLSSFGFSCLDHQMGYLTNVVELPVFQLVSMRTGVVSCIFLAHVIKTRPPYGPYCPPQVRWLIWLRGLLCAVGLVTAYTAMGYLTQSEFMTMYCCAPFATGIMCWAFVGERFSRLQVICCCISLVGVVLITNPFRSLAPHEDMPDDPSHQIRQIDDRIPDTLATKLIGVALMLPCLVILGGEMVIMRLVKEQATTSQVMVIISLCPALSSGVLMGVARSPAVFPPDLIGWVVLVTIVPTGLLAQLSLTYASQRISGLKVTLAIYSGVRRGHPPAIYSGLVHSTWIQWVVYGNHPGVSAFLGAVIIVVAGVYSIVYGPTDDSSPVGEYSRVESEEEPANSAVPLLQSPPA